MRQRTARAQKDVNAFNKRHGIGSQVTYWSFTRRGRGVASKTRGEAFVLEGHTAVVHVEGYTPCIALTHIGPTPPYCAGYRPLKTTFLPGQRVHWNHSPSDAGTIVTALWNILRKEDWVVVAFDDGSTDALAERDITHVPYTRGPAWPPQSEE